MLSSSRVSSLSVYEVFPSALSQCRGYTVSEVLKCQGHVHFLDSQANTKFKGFGFRVLGFRAWGAFSFSDFRRVYVKVWGFEFCSTTYLV